MCCYGNTIMEIIIVAIATAVIRNLTTHYSYSRRTVLVVVSMLSPLLSNIVYFAVYSILWYALFYQTNYTILPNMVCFVLPNKLYYLTKYGMFCFTKQTILSYQIWYVLFYQTNYTILPNMVCFVLPNKLYYLTKYFNICRTKIIMYIPIIINSCLLHRIVYIIHYCIQEYRNRRNTNIPRSPTYLLKLWVMEGFSFDELVCCAVSRLRVS